ncbi:MAG: tRNA 2-thiocytidine biosynthesis TtcA family protein [Oscillospiraceae bacterium]
MQSFTGTVRRCIADYDMIKEGDHVAVGVSGGKDSLALLCALAELRLYYPKKFELYALTLSMGFPGMDFTPVKELCRRLDVPYIIKQTQIAPVVFEARQEKNPCALCSKMRRGALNDTINELGIKKLALGHHLDDAIETFLMSLLYEGRITCFQPVTYMSRADIAQIRPLVYCREQEVINYVNRLSLPVVKSTCPMDKESSREDIKQLIDQLSGQFPDLKSKLFGAIKRYPLRGWEKPEEK